MKILLVNKFLYPKGGDAISTLATGELLQKKGHRVLFWGMQHPDNPLYPMNSYFVSYVDLNKAVDIREKFKTAARILYSFEAKRKVEKLIEKERPDVVHLNNFAHQISPSIIDVFVKWNIPMVMTIHDYKLVCPSYTMLSNGKVCERCKDSRYYQCFVNKCAKNSYLKSSLNTAEMYLHHKILHIYDSIDIFISPSTFLKNKLEEMGFKREIVYLPHFLNTEDYIPGYNSNEKTICYFGRFSHEKGILTLLDAIKGIDIRLKLIGDGPERANLERKISNENLNNVSFLGHKSRDDLKKEVGKSMFVVVPSEWYEIFGLVIIEALALGKPVIGSRIGGIPELVKDGKTGLLFEPGSSDDLRSKIEYLINNPEKVTEMGKNARKFVEENFSEEKHYQDLVKIYQIVIEKHR